MDLSLELYRSMLVAMKRGNYRGVFSNAKPMFILAVIDSIPNILQANKIEISNIFFKEKYINQFDIYKQGNPTPIEKPLFHLRTEPFYELIWLNDSSSNILYSPSAKYLRKNLAYAKLDDLLWELLQKEYNREYLKNCIIENYLTIN